MRLLPLPTSNRLPLALLLLVVLTLGSGGCATIRVTNPPRTADEQFLQSVAIRRAVSKLSFASLRDRNVYVDSSYLFDGNFPSNEQSFLLGELRNKALIEGVSLKDSYAEADIILEVRSGAIGVNRSDFLLGVPGLNAQVGTVDVGSANVPLILPEVAIVKTLEQRGYASVSLTAYWRDSGDLVASSGPFVGETERKDVWFLGIGPSTTGTIPPAESE